MIVKSSKTVTRLKSGGGGSVANTIYNASDAISDISRVVTLYGNTNSDKLIFRNQAANDVLTLYGNRAIDVYLDSTATDTFKVYRGASPLLTINSRDRELGILGSLSNTQSRLGVDSLNNGYLGLYGEDAVFTAYSSTSAGRAYFGMNSNRGYLELRGTDDIRDIIFNAGSTCYFRYSTFTVGSNTAANASCLIDLISTTKGFGLPVMTTAQKTAIGTPRAGLVVFDTTIGAISAYNGAAWI